MEPKGDAVVISSWWWRGLLLSAGYIMGQVGGGGDCSCRQVKSWVKLVVEGTAPVGRLSHGSSWWWRGLLLSAGYIMGQVGD